MRLSDGLFSYKQNAFPQSVSYRSPSLLPCAATRILDWWFGSHDLELVLIWLTLVVFYFSFDDRILVSCPSRGVLND